MNYWPTNETEKLLGQRTSYNDTKILKVEKFHLKDLKTKQAIKIMNYKNKHDIINVFGVKTNNMQPAVLVGSIGIFTVVSGSIGAVHIAWAAYRTSFSAAKKLLFLWSRF